MDLREIPRMLFEEFGEKAQILSERVMVAETGIKNLRLRYVESKHNASIDVYWGELEDEDISPEFTISAGARNSGTWAYGCGDRMEETVSLNLKPTSFWLTRSDFASIMLLSMMVTRVAQLLRELPFEVSSFWSGEAAKIRKLEEGLGGVP